MKKYLTRIFMLSMVSLLFVGMSSCDKSTDDSTMVKVLGNWRFDQSQTTYSVGLVLAVSGQTTLIDTATVISTVKTLFGNSDLAFKADSTGVLTKNILEESTSSETSLASILNGFTGQYLNKAFTYTAKSNKIKITMDSKLYVLTVLSASETQLKVSMPISDVTSWVSGVLGDKVDNIAESSIFTTIEQIAGTLGVFASPTVVLTFNKPRG